MHKDIFFRIGQSIYKCRWAVIVFWLILLIASFPFMSKLMDPFNAVGFTDANSQSAQANTDLNNKLGYSYNRFIVMYRSDKMTTANPEFFKEIHDSLSGLEKFHIQHQIIYPTDKNKQVSPDKHTAYAVILFKGKQEIGHQILDECRGHIKHPHHLNLQIGGAPVFLDDTKKQTQIDLFKAEYFATPAAIITMLVVFGSVVAAILPIVLGGFCALFILMTLFTLGHIFSLSVFTINIALLLGLCLNLDYSILIINRYRDELAQGHSVGDALAITQTTAGKAVFFSALAVFISLSALLLFKINVLFSVGLGGLAAVLVAAAVALILLPAVLAVLNNRINLLKISLFKPKKSREHTYWYRFITKVVNNPKMCFFSCLIALLLLGFPFLHAQFGISDFRILPTTFESRQVFDDFRELFGESKLEPIIVVIKSPHEEILTKKNIGHLFDFASKLKSDPRVKDVTSIVTTTPRLTKEQYQDLYTKYKDHIDPDLKKYLTISTHDGLTVMDVISNSSSNSPETFSLIKTIRNSTLGNNMTVQVTGSSANVIDVKSSISRTFPKAFFWIVAFTYIILLFLLRSVVLPLKAILTTILSLCASYGVLVLIIQQGHLHTLLNFEPQGMLDISLLIIIFCALFGISMDYEVFLLTRIKEYYEQTGNNIKSIVLGIDRSSKIISSAAIVVILICVSFMSADILMVKAFGLGIAVAVFVDAFIIRLILVPATMTLLGKWNWYLPRFLNRILPKITFDPEPKLHKKK